MSKHHRMSQFAAQLIREAHGMPGLADLHPCYAGYFLCFNREQYYEAHDVLEHLWLKSTGRDWDFYKALIQFAGAFVHLRLQHMRPSHARHGTRLKPAARLLRIAAASLSTFGPKRLRLDTAAVAGIAFDLATEIERGEFRLNPWQPGKGPRILPAENAPT